MDRSCWLGTTIALLVALDCLLDCWANDLFYPNVGRNCEGLMGFPWDPHTFDVFYWIVKRFCDGQPFAEVPQRPGRGVRLTAPAGVFLLLHSAESFTTRQEPRSPVGAYMPTSKSAWLLGLWAVQSILNSTRYRFGDHRGTNQPPSCQDRQGLFHLVDLSTG